MRYSPHEYQRYAIRFIKEHPVAAVFLDMGMGKSSIALTAAMELMFEEFEVGKVLVVAPLRVARHTWAEEIGKWDHLEGLRYSVAVGTKKERMRALSADADIYIINRENIPWLVEKSGLPFDFDMLVVDELSSFKSCRSQRFRALMKVRPKVKRVVGLTGTPSPGGLMDLFAEFKLLDMGERLGRYIGQYREAYFRPDRRNGPVVYSYKPLPGAQERIYGRISDITVSMRGTEHLRMPELISCRHLVHLGEGERRKYEGLKGACVLQTAGGEVTAANAAALSGKLLQLANGAVYTDEGGVQEVHGRKLDALEDMAEAANGKPLLVAYWFRHDLARIEGRLSERGIPHGRLDTPEGIRRWNAGEMAVGLIHPASAGHGLNLQGGGSTLVWFGLTWSLELYRQTVARLWRQGQRAGTVVVQHIITAGTMDERVMEALERKEDVQSALLAAVREEVGNGAEG